MVRMVQEEFRTYFFARESTWNQSDWKPIGQVELPSYVIAPEITWNQHDWKQIGL